MSATTLQCFKSQPPPSDFRHKAPIRGHEEIDMTMMTHVSGLKNFAQKFPSVA